MNVKMLRTRFIQLSIIVVVILLILPTAAFASPADSENSCTAANASSDVNKASTGNTENNNNSTVTEKSSNGTTCTNGAVPSEKAVNTSDSGDTASTGDAPGSTEGNDNNDADSLAKDIDENSDRATTSSSEESDDSNETGGHSPDKNDNNAAENDGTGADDATIDNAAATVEDNSESDENIEGSDDQIASEPAQGNSYEASLQPDSPIEAGEPTEFSITFKEVGDDAIGIVILKGDPANLSIDFGVPLKITSINDKSWRYEPHHSEPDELDLFFRSASNSDILGPGEFVTFSFWGTAWGTFNFITEVYADRGGNTPNYPNECADKGLVNGGILRVNVNGDGAEPGNGDGTEPGNGTVTPSPGPGTGWSGGFFFTSLQATAAEVAGAQTLVIAPEVPLVSPDQFLVIKIGSQDDAQYRLINVDFIIRGIAEELAALMAAYTFFMADFEANQNSLSETEYAYSIIDLAVAWTAIQTVEARINADSASLEKALIAYQEALKTVETYGSLLAEEDMQTVRELLDAVAGELILLGAEL